ncbi:MAG TPA: SRPBCC family protein [Chitinophagales bacterium]|nr:SRPBCC family protein [Chitinophagales bacterium]
MSHEFATTPDCEIISDRILNAPVEKVYNAFANPEHLKNWWGPNGFTNTIHEFDLRVDGKWRLTMHGPDKGNYNNESVFLKIIPNELIYWQRVSKPLFQMAIIFNKITENTSKITFRMMFDSAEECNKIRPFAPEKNEENFDRLESELTKMTS